MRKWYLDCVTPDGDAAGPLAGLLPRRIARAAETKWISQGRLQDDRGTEDGWVIHEVVEGG